MEENFTLVGKSRGKNEPSEKKKGKEETSSSSQEKELLDLKWEEMDKVIKILSHKVVKLELDNKSILKRNTQGNNRGYNPKYRRPLLQILQRERKDQLDQIPPPLYIEDYPYEQLPNTHDMQENLYSSFSEEEQENMAHHEMCHDTEEIVNEEDIGDYCKQFADFMQAQLHQNYDLRSSKKRPRELEQQEETAPQNVSRVLNKGKGKLNPDLSKVKFSLNK